MARIAKDPDERRSELIACAQQLFYSKGYESTSVRDIVDAAGVAKGTFYYYFDSKPAVLEAVVDELIAYSVALMKTIIDNPSLNATDKWIQALQIVGNWKTEHKSEMIALLRLLQADENALLQYKIRTKTVEVLAPELSRIVEQGVEEGVFDTEFVEAAGEIALMITMSLSNTMIDILLNPEAFDDPLTLARQNISAVQTAVERVLGAEQGSLPLIDHQTLTAWFEGQKEPALERVL